MIGDQNVLGADRAIFFCPSSHALGYTFIEFEFVMVENAGFAVRILTLPITVPEM